MRFNTIKLLEENIGRILSDINHSNIFFDPSSRIMKVKTKINKWNLLKLKNFCKVKETVNKTKKQPTNCEKIFSNDVANEISLWKLQTCGLTSSKQITQSKNWQKCFPGSSVVKISPAMQGTLI